MDVRLGKQPPFRYYSDIKIKVASYLTMEALSPPPSILPAIGRGIDFKMYLNDTLGDCTCAALGHKEQIDSARTHAPDVPTNDIIRDLYHQTGLQQGLSDNDGRYMEGVLKYARETGILQAAGDPTVGAGGREKILGYAAVNFMNDIEFRTALWLFGGLYIGMALPETAARQIEAGKSWSLDHRLGGNAAPGSWGGHAVYATTGVTLITWAARQEYTAGFRKTYFDECYAVLTEDWVQRTTAPNGFNKQQLIEDLAAI